MSFAVCCFYWKNGLSIVSAVSVQAILSKRMGQAERSGLSEQTCSSQKHQMDLCLHDIFVVLDRLSVAALCGGVFVYEPICFELAAGNA